MHTALSHLDKRHTYVRMLFNAYSSAFNTIVSTKLIIKLEALGLNPALCNWSLDFLTGRTQVVKEGRKHNWEHPVKLYHRLVRQLHRCPQPQSYPEGGAVCPTQYLGQTSLQHRFHRKAKKIIKDINHPSYCLFTPLSSKRRGQYMSIKAGTERLKNS